MTAITVTDLFLELAKQRASETIKVDIGDATVDVIGVKYDADGVTLDIAEELCVASALTEAEQDCAEAEDAHEKLTAAVKMFLAFVEDFDWDLLPDGWADALQALTDIVEDQA